MRDLLVRPFEFNQESKHLNENGPLCVRVGIQDDVAGLVVLEVPPHPAVTGRFKTSQWFELFLILVFPFSSD